MPRSVCRTTIDALFHGPGWAPRPQFDTDVAALAATDRWVTEWQYDTARPVLAAHADLLVWLDLPRLLVLARVTRRTVRRRLQSKALWNGNREPPLQTLLTDPEHVIPWSWTTHPLVVQRVAGLDAALPVVRLRTPARSAAGAPDRCTLLAPARPQHRVRDVHHLTGLGDDVLGAVGPRLRALRTGRGATLAELAETTGISVSTLSRLESGGRKPTLELLLPLARAHQVALDELVDAPPTGDPRLHPRPVVRHGLTFLPLTRRPGGLQAYKIVYPPRWPDGEPDLRTHEGYEWLYVLNGRLRLLLGERDLVLLPGEAVEFDTHVPHWLGNPFAKPAEALALFGKQGERAHVRAAPLGRDGQTREHG